MDKRKVKIFLRLLEIHIGSKTTGTQFHKDTEKAYELAFDHLHLTEEMKQNLWVGITTTCDENWQESYDLLKELKVINEEEVKSNEDIGYDDELRGLARRMTDLCGTFKQYTKEIEEDEEEEEEPKKVEVKRTIPWKY